MEEILKRVASLLILAAMYVSGALLLTAMEFMMDYLDGVPWTQVISAGLIAVIVACNWYMVDTWLWD